MEQLGTVRILRKSEGNVKYGHISPTSPIPNYDRSIVFFENDLEDVSFDSLKSGMKLKFCLEQRRDKRGEIEWIARKIYTVEASVSDSDSVSRPVHKKSVSASTLQTSLRIPSLKFLIDQFSDALKLIEEIQDSHDFEDAAFALLRLIGIHTVYQYPRETQAGRADGFFILDNLAVMYDCTLREPFEDYKKDQIENYINKLNNKSQLTIETRRSDGGLRSTELKIQGKSRQVWIVTRGVTREIQNFDGIKVKEVAVQDLIQIALKRCRQLNYDADMLSTELLMLGA